LGGTLKDAPAPFSRCKNSNRKQITRIDIGDHPNPFFVNIREALHI
jgi:hypothetical protein